MKLRPPEGVNLAGQSDEDLGRRHLSHSSISLLLACPRKFDLHYNHQLELIERPRPLSLGRAFQKGIEAQSPQHAVYAIRGLEPCDVCFGEGEVQTGLDDWGECEDCGGAGWVEGPSMRLTLTQEQDDKLAIDEAIVEAAVTAYLKQWPAKPTETREFEYRVRLRNPATGAYSLTFDLLGYADGLVEPGYMAGRADDLKGFELQENKLVGQIRDQKVQLLPLDRQVALARYGIWRATGRKVETVRYRWTRKPMIRQKQNETVEEFCMRIRQDYVDRPDFYLHEEEPQFATTGDLLRIEAELWEWAEMVRGNDKRKIYPRNTSNCTEYGGCQFIPICTGDPDATSLYRKRADQPEPAEATT